MTIHLLKLSVGPDSLADLARWQNARLKEKKKKRQPLLLQHVTRMTVFASVRARDRRSSLSWMETGNWSP